MKKFEDLKKIGSEIYDAGSIMVIDAYNAVEAFFMAL